MTQPITTDPDLMRRIANDHEDIACQIASTRSVAEQIAPAVATWGNIMWRTKAAVTELLARHDQSLLEEAGQHWRMAEQLRAHAAAFEAADDANAAHIAGIA